MTDDPQLKFRQRIEQIFDALDQYSYYDLFNLQPNCGRDDIRASFHRMALRLHPDNFQSHEDRPLAQKVKVIYKRMAEGYRVLSSYPLRSEYDKGLEQGQTRLVKKERQQKGPKRLEAGINNPQAKKFFLLAQDAERRGDMKTAKLNYGFADKLERGNPVIAERLAAVSAAQ